MTDKELIKALEPLKNKMEHFTATAQGSLTAEEVMLMKQLYPEFQARAQGQLPRTFIASCSSCIRETFSIYASWYSRTVEELNKQDEALNKAIREEFEKQMVVEPTPKKMTVKTKK